MSYQTLENVSKRNVERKSAKRWLDDIRLNFPSIQCICNCVKVKYFEARKIIV